MKWAQFVPLILVISVLGSCIAPVNLNYDSARMLDSKEIEVTGSGSSYLVYFADTNSNNLQTNLGVSFRYGVTPKYNIGLTYEGTPGIAPHENALYELEEGIGYDYFEFNNKLSLKEDRIALSLPIGVYAIRSTKFFSEQIYFFNPRFLFNIPLKPNKINLNINPKAQILIADGFGAWPGLSIGGEFSSNLNRWAIRPEVGFDGFFSAGIGFSYRFNQKAFALE